MAAALTGDGEIDKAMATPGTSILEPNYGSSSETDVELRNVDEEKGKDFIQKHITLTFRDLTVRVTAPDEALGETLWSRVDPRQLKSLFGSDSHMKRVGHNASFCS